MPLNIVEKRDDRILPVFQKEKICRNDSFTCSFFIPSDSFYMTTRSISYLPVHLLCTFLPHFIIINDIMLYVLYYCVNYIINYVPFIIKIS